MNREPSDQPLDKDPIWDLLRQAPRHEAGPRFTDDVVRAARLAGQTDSWWKRPWFILSIGGAATAATAAVAIMITLRQPAEAPPEVVAHPPSASDSLVVLDDMVRTEALLVAVEHPSAFSDAELVSLITY